MKPGARHPPAYGDLLERCQSLIRTSPKVSLISTQKPVAWPGKSQESEHRMHLLAAGSTRQDLLRRGVISDDVFRRLVSEIDAELRQVE